METPPYITLNMRKAAAFTLALIWLALSYIFFDVFGSDDAQPAFLDTIAYAIPAAMPLLIGAFVVNSREGSAKYLRLACAVLLGIEVAFLLVTFHVLFILALFFGGFIPLLGLWLLLLPEINRYCYGRK